MAKQEKSTASHIPVVRLLVELADADSVYRDVHLRRARELLAGELSLDAYRGLANIQQQIDAAVAKSRAATVLQDWALVQAESAKADQLRRSADQRASLRVVGEQVYDAPTVVVDPFSPGLGGLAKGGGDPADVRDRTVATLMKLAADDPSARALYDARREFFAGLTLARARTETRTDAPKTRSTAELERLAFEAAQRGEVGELNRLAQEIIAQKEADAKAAPSTTATASADAAPAPVTDPCPVDLAAPLPAGVETRAAALGLAPATTEPQPQTAPLIEYVAARIGQAGLAESENELEGALKIESLVDQGVWPEGVADHVKVLVGQFVRHTFVNSGGGRYRPVSAAEAILVEDFPEDRDPPADSRLLAALGLPKRRGLARVEIEDALLARGASVLASELGLDPLEFRLVCIPPDLYTRIGRARGWGAAPQWTHFDGYQVIKGGRLRALVGGDTRYGGIADLASIAATDRRESVIARFAVVRRARQVARWH
jgi:hypothetical protein